MGESKAKMWLHSFMAPNIHSAPISYNYLRGKNLEPEFGLKN